VQNFITIGVKLDLHTKQTFKQRSNLARFYRTLATLATTRKATEGRTKPTYVVIGRSGLSIYPIYIFSLCSAVCRLGAVPFIATVGLRAARDSRLGRWGSSAQRGVRVLSAGRNTGSGADLVDAVRAVGSALIFCTGSAKERNFSATGSVS
jgi:hypothetical protein